MRTIVSTLLVFLIAVSLHAAPTFQLQIINNVADPAAGTFTVKANGTDIAKNLGFRQAIALKTLPLPLKLTIVSSNAAYGEIERDYTAEQYENGTLILTLHGVADPSKFSTPDLRDITYNLHEFALLPDAIQPSKVAFTVLHSATDLPKFDLRAVGDNAFSTDMEYGQITPFTAAVSPKEYTLTLNPAGDFATVWKEVVADFSQDAGKHVYIMPSGFQTPSVNQNGPGLELLGVYADGKVVVFQPAAVAKFAKLQLIHASADPVLETVDVYINTNKVADNIGYRGASSFLNVPAEESLSIVVAEPNSNSFDDKVIATLTASALPENSYSAVLLHGVVNATGFAANPTGTSIALSVVAIPNARLTSSTPGAIDLMACHAVTDVGTVDVVVDGVGTVITELPYGGRLSDYMAIVPGAYTIRLTPTGQNNTFLKSFTGNLAPLAGQAVTLVAAGFYNPEANKNGAVLSLFAITTTGTAIVLDPVAVTVTEEQTLRSSLSVAPNPASDATVVSFELPSAAVASISVYDAAGRRVANLEQGVLSAGRIAVPVPTNELAPGVYVVTLQAGGYSASRTMTVTR